ncbi:MAG: PilN domain-containing protein [Deltaproteobacteria bacterium]|nr:PilN domain-containing protein [Deltaproteobacteria bacterium]
MIRINLLPRKPVKRKSKGGLDILILLCVLIAEAAVLYFLYSALSGQVEDQQRANGIKQAKIDSIKSDIKDHEEIKAELEEIDAREQIIQELIAGRTGPVQMLMELASVLSLGSGPSLHQEKYQELLKRDPSAGFNPEWDSRRLWVIHFMEEDRQVEMEGKAMSNEDVGEFLRRLKLSDYFYAEALVNTKEVSVEKSTVPIVSWKIKLKVRYR